MPRKQTHPSQLGKVCVHHGKFCARFQPQDFGQATLFSGPGHDNENRASEDLSAIRTAGAEHAARMAALAAMRQEAKRLKDESRSESGGLDARGDEIRARLRYSHGGTVHNIKGPNRLEECNAQADLEAIRAAGMNKPTRAEYIEAMQAEARSIATNIALRVVACIIYCLERRMPAGNRIFKKNYARQRSLIGLIRLR